jgi:hypothetical protein
VGDVVGDAPGWWAGAAGEGAAAVAGGEGGELGGGGGAVFAADVEDGAGWVEHHSLDAGAASQAAGGGC